MWEMQFSGFDDVLSMWSDGQRVREHSSGLGIQSQVLSTLFEEGISNMHVFWSRIRYLALFYDADHVFFMLQILHHHIALVEKLALTTSGCPLVIQCKNFRIVHFIVPRERDCHDIYNSLLQLSKQGTVFRDQSLLNFEMDYLRYVICHCYFIIEVTLKFLCTLFQKIGLGTNQMLLL